MLKQLRSSSIKKIVVVFQTRMDLLSQPNLDKVIGWLTPHNTETFKALQATQKAVFSMQPYFEPTRRNLKMGDQTK